MKSKEELREYIKDAESLREFYEAADAFWKLAEKHGERRPRLAPFFEKFQKSVGIMVSMIPDRLRAINIAVESASLTMEQVATMVLDAEDEAVPGQDPRPYTLREFSTKVRALMHNTPIWWDDGKQSNVCHSEYLRLWHKEDPGD